MLSSSEEEWRPGSAARRHGLLGWRSGLRGAVGQVVQGEWHGCGPPGGARLERYMAHGGRPIGPDGFLKWERRDCQALTRARQFLARS